MEVRITMRSLTPFSSALCASGAKVNILDGTYFAAVVRSRSVRIWRPQVSVPGLTEAVIGLVFFLGAVGAALL